MSEDEFVEMKMERVSSHGMRWERDGTCYEQVDDGPWERRPDCDWGTPTGDLLIDPWIQDILKEKP